MLINCGSNPSMAWNSWTKSLERPWGVFDSICRNHVCCLLVCIIALLCHRIMYHMHISYVSWVCQKKLPPMTFLRNLGHGLSRTFLGDCMHACSRLVYTLNIQCNFMLMCLWTRFHSSFLENFTWYALGCNIFIAKFETLVDKNVVILCILWN